MKRITLALLLLSGLAGCSGIGQGSTLQTLKIAPSPVGILDQGVLLNADTPAQTFRMYDCFCSNVAAIGTFTDGTLANFSFRTHWTSSDPNVVEVVNSGDATNSLCPLTQQGPGLLIPKASSGSAVITAEFAGISASFNVEIQPTDAAALVLEPADALKTGAVAVGSSLPLQVVATLDHQPRFLSGNVTTWSLNPSDTTLASITTTGAVLGRIPDQGATLEANAAFGTCAAAPSPLRIRVGEVSALDLEEEAGFTDAGDHSLAVNNNELLALTGTIDFQDPANPVNPSDPANKQVLDAQAKYDYRESCTQRSFSATPDGSSTLAGCVEAAATCTSATPICPTAMSACASGMTACRVGNASMVLLGSDRIIAAADSAGADVNFFATFPARLGTATTLAADTAAGATSLTVTALAGYPTTVPWEAVLDKGQASQEIVTITAVSTNTLTLEAPTQFGHPAATSTFEQRSFESDQAPIKAVQGTLTSVRINPPAAMSPLGSLQLDARGTFQNPDTLATRGERVSHLTTFGSGSPSIAWTSSAPRVLSVGGTTGLVTSLSACGGQAVIRARISSSGNTADTAFVAATGAADTSPQNGNDDGNDAECGESGVTATDKDALCDQVTITIPTPPADQLPAGVTCP